MDFGQALYAIFDLKALQVLSGLLQIIPSDAAAERWFRDLIQSPGTLISTHPEDFVLVRVGMIDQESLSIKSYGVGASDPVITGSAIIRYQDRVANLDTESPVESSAVTA